MVCAVSNISFCCVYHAHLTLTSVTRSKVARVDIPFLSDSADEVGGVSSHLTS